MEEQLDDGDIQLAHSYRLSLAAAPRQSSFRVVAVIFYELLNDDANQQEQQRLHVVGTNDEPCYINGSICAERAALVQLRFLPLKRITKIIITADAPHPIFPGMLCREFMSSHLYIDPETTPIVIAGSVCQAQGQGARADCNLDIGANGTHHDLDRLESGCSMSLGKYHGWEVVRTTLCELYPHASPYTRLTAGESFKLGTRLSAAAASMKDDDDDNFVREKGKLSKTTRALIQKATAAAQEGNDRSELHPIQYGAAVLFTDGSVQTACQMKTLEYGCSLDAVTQLATSIGEKMKVQVNGNGHGNDNGDGNGDGENKPEIYAGIRPRLLVQTDQFGVVHTPFASARAFLSEFGYGDCGVLVKGSGSPGLTGLEEHQDIVEVTVNDIAPSVPQIRGLWKE